MTVSIYTTINQDALQNLVKITKNRYKMCRRKSFCVFDKTRKHLMKYFELKGEETLWGKKSSLLIKVLTFYIYFSTLYRLFCLFFFFDLLVFQTLFKKKAQLNNVLLFANNKKKLTNTHGSLCFMAKAVKERPLWAGSEYRVLSPWKK